MPISLTETLANMISDERFFPTSWWLTMESLYSVRCDEGVEVRGLSMDSVHSCGPVLHDIY
jgi:hypothetical protein